MEGRCIADLSQESNIEKDPADLATQLAMTVSLLQEEINGKPHLLLTLKKLEQALSLEGNSMSITAIEDALRLIEKLEELFLL